MQDATSKTWPEQTPAAARDLLEGRFSACIEQVTSISRGYTPVSRLLLRLDDGRSIFAKVATERIWIERLRFERRVYQEVRAAHLPVFEAFLEQEGCAVLVLEDLSRDNWPPPWTPGRIDSVLEAIESIGRTEPPAHVKAFEPAILMNWPKVHQDPSPFLSLGLCRPDWLATALPTLITAEANAPITGERLIHADIRSDNICLRGDKAIIIDWDNAALSTREVELAAWVPSLHAEGGPPPEELLPGQPELAAFLAGFLAARAGLPDLRPGSRVRDIQRFQLLPAFAWAIRALGLPPPL